MNTLIDIIVLLLAYGGLSLICSVLLRVLWVAPKQTDYEQVTNRGW